MTTALLEAIQSWHDGDKRAWDNECRDLRNRLELSPTLEALKKQVEDIKALRGKITTASSELRFIFPERADEEKRLGAEKEAHFDKVFRDMNKLWQQIDATMGRGEQASSFEELHGLLQEHSQARLQQAKHGCGVQILTGIPYCNKV